MSFQVHITLGKDPHIEVEGTSIERLRRDQLSDVLRGESDLRDRIAKRHHGHKPDDFHLSDQDRVPGHLAGTMAKYRWKPAQMVVTAGHARFIEVRSDPVVVGRAKVRNEHDTLSYDAEYEITEGVSNEIGKSSNWDFRAGSSTTVGVEVGGDAAGGKISASTTISLEAGYGESKSKSEAANNDATGKGTVPLAPGQRAIVGLNATRGVASAQVDYHQVLNGGVFYHFGRRVEGHYLWYAPLARLYGAHELQVKHTDDLHVKVYSEWDIALLPWEE